MPKDRNVLIDPQRLNAKQMREVTVALAKSAPEDLSKFTADWLIRHQGDIQSFLRWKLEEYLQDAEEVAWWQEFYGKIFGIKADFQKLAHEMPKPMDFVDSLVVVPPRLSLETVLEVCKLHFPLLLTNEAEESLLEATGTWDEVHPKGYVLRTRANDSHNFLTLAMPPSEINQRLQNTMSLKERLLLELTRVVKGETPFLDAVPSFDTHQQMATLCAGPRVHTFGWIVVYGETDHVIIDQYSAFIARAEKPSREPYGRWVVSNGSR